MKRTQTIIVKVLMLLLMIQGLIILLYSHGIEPVRGTIDGFLNSIPDAPHEKRLLGIIAAWGMVALGFIGFIPMPRFRRNRAVTFFSGHGNITIQLDPIYRTMHRIINKMPEVRSCRIDIKPTADGKKVCIQANARLYKLPRQRARATALRVSDYIADTAMNFLGLEDLVSVDLNIQDFTVDVDESVRALAQEGGDRDWHEESNTDDLLGSTLPEVTGVDEVHLGGDMAERLEAFEELETPPYVAPDTDETAAEVPETEPPEAKPPRDEAPEEAPAQAAPALTSLPDVPPREVTGDDITPPSDLQAREEPPRKVGDTRVIPPVTDMQDTDTQPPEAMAADNDVDDTEDNTENKDSDPGTR
ncbi:MAG: hypothetical protein ACLFTT_14420 [Candidatus Hydrogenedentota bacterium]